MNHTIHTSIYIASDHAGFKLKQDILKWMKENMHPCIDLGPVSYDENDDYPDTLKLLAVTMQKDKRALGIVLGGSGTGEAIVLNKYKGVRAGLWYGGNIEIIKLAKLHNNINVLSLGARFVEETEVHNAITMFLETSFQNEERHVRRISKVDQIIKDHNRVAYYGSLLLCFLFGSIFFYFLN